MPHTIWSGAISFGLVNIPVKVSTAVSHKQVRFHQLHDEDGVRIQYQKVCPADGEEIPADHIVKGYQVGPDEYVTITKEELEALNPKGSHTIDIESFAELSQIDPLYFDKPYVLTPDTGGAKAYRLLLEALRESDHVAIARVVLRSKEYVVVLRAYGDAIAMTTLNYVDEVVTPEDIDGLPDDDIEFAPRELKMARQLIEALVEDFDPSKYKDTYRELVLDLIEQKAAGESIVVQQPSEEKAPVIDLMAALERSVENAKPRSGGKRSSGAKRKRTKAAS